MRTTYRILADVIAVAVVVQAMAMIWAIAGLFHWIDGGGTLNHDVLKKWEDNPPDFQGAAGFAIHGILGGMVIPVVALALLVVAFFAKIPGGAKWAAFVLVSVVVQVIAGYSGDDAPWVGLVHGLNAFALFSLAIMAARLGRPVIEPETQTAVAATP